MVQLNVDGSQNLLINFLEKSIPNSTRKLDQDSATQVVRDFLNFLHRQQLFLKFMIKENETWDWMKRNEKSFCSGKKGKWESIFGLRW
jgi:hypothetical protein